MKKIENQPSVRGYFEGVRADVAYGWAYAESRDIEVEVYIDGESAGCTRANIFRKDLLNANIGDGNHGFRFAIPVKYCDGHEHQFTVKDKLTNQLLVAPKPNQVIKKSESLPFVPSKIQSISYVNPLTRTAHLGKKNFAFLVMAHHQPKHLKRLLQRIHHPEFYFFIHIDAKSPIAEFIEELKELSNVFFLIDRIETTWGSFSMVKAMLYCLQAARSSGVLFHRFSFISGVDYPIKSVKSIIDTLSGEDEFVSCVPITDKHPELISRIQNYHFLDEFKFLAFKHQSSLKIESAIKPYATELIAELNNKLTHNIPKHYPFEKIYKGSQWMSLSRGFCDYLIEFVNQRPDVVEFFKFTKIPDESFIQTIYMYSPYVDKRRGSIPDNLHYVDFKVVPGPKDLDEEDIDHLKSSKALFARKIIEGKSAKLIELIDTEILGVM